MPKKTTNNSKPRRAVVDTKRHHQIKVRLSEEEYQALRKRMAKCKMTQQTYLVKCIRKAPIYDLTAVQNILPLLLESKNLLAGINRTSEEEEVKHAMETVTKAWDELYIILKQNNATK